MSYDAFLSYAHHDGLHEGFINMLKQELERFASMHLGRSARIFQDREELHVGQLWQIEVESALKCPCLVPLITPKYLESNECIKEFVKFVDSKINNEQIPYILPLYFLKVPAIEHLLGRLDMSLEQKSYNEKQSRILNELIKRQIEDIRWLHTDTKNALNTQKGREMLDRVGREIAVRTAGMSATPTNVVSSGESEFQTISAAIRRAKPGTRILVKGPAEYRESLFIDKPLEIIGENGVILTGTDGPAIASIGSPVHIAKMNIRSDNYNSIIISGGFCILEQLEVGKSNYSGVLVRDHAEVIVVECLIQHAEHCGLHAQIGSKCTVISNTITDNKVGGLFFSENAEGLVDGNLIEHNKVNGIYIAAGANPRVRRNQIRFHERAGILVYRHKEFRGYEPGRGIIEDNEISGNKQFGIQIDEGANPCVRRNIIKANEFGGIWTRNGGRGKIYENQIIENIGSGIKNEGGQPRLGRNMFLGNGGQSLEDYGGAIQDSNVLCED